MWQLPLDRQELWMERHCKVHNKGSRGGKQRQGHPARACCVLRERTGGWLIKFLKGSTFGLKKTHAPVVAWARTTVTTTAVWMWVIWGRSAVRLATFKNWRNWLFSRRITLFFFFFLMLSANERTIMNIPEKCTLSVKGLNYSQCHLSQIRPLWVCKSKWNYMSLAAGKLIMLLYFLLISLYRCWQINVMMKILMYKLLHNEINCVIPNISGDAGEKMIIFSQGLIWSES